jgi:hypothetical protein
LVNGGAAVRTVDEILGQVQHLSAGEQQELMERLAALDSFLALAGTGHGDFTDVSSHKGKHLAEAYGPKDDRR